MCRHASHVSRWNHVNKVTSVTCNWISINIVIATIMALVSLWRLEMKGKGFQHPHGYGYYYYCNIYRMLVGCLLSHFTFTQGHQTYEAMSTPYNGTILFFSRNYNMSPKWLYVFFSLAIFVLKSLCTQKEQPKSLFILSVFKTKQIILYIHFKIASILSWSSQM